MNELERFYYFWWFCIPIRTFIGIFAVILSFTGNIPIIFVLGIYSFITGIWLGVNILRTHIGLKKTGGLGGRVWWKNARYIHCFNWLATSVLCFLQLPGAGTPLLFDALFGIAFGAIHFGCRLDIWQRYRYPVEFRPFAYIRAYIRVQSYYMTNLLSHIVWCV